MKFQHSSRPPLSGTHYELREVALTLAGLGCIMFSIYWYRQTVINPWLFLALPAVLMGWAAARLWPKRPGEIYGYNTTYLFVSGFVAHTVLWGGVFSALLLGLNRAWLRDGTQQRQGYAVLAKSSMTGERGEREKRKPVVSVEIAGQLKSLIFEHENTATLDSIQTVQVTTQTGLLGFVVLLRADAAKH